MESMKIKYVTSVSPKVHDAVWALFEEVGCDDRAKNYAKELWTVAQDLFDMGSDEFREITGIEFETQIEY